MGDTYAMEPSSVGMLAMMGGMFWLFMIGIYIIGSWLFFRIAKNAGCTENAWWAWVPILNLFLMCQMGGKSYWWVLLFLVPIVNIVAIIALSWQIARNCGQSGWWGVCMLIPFIGIAATCVLAFSTPNKGKSMPPSRPTTQPRQPVSA